MRNINKLLQLVSDNFDRLFDTGLCGIASDLNWSRVITSDEEVRLKDFIEINRPDWSSFIRPTSAYHWKPGRVAPRKRWLKRHIRRTANA